MFFKPKFRKVCGRESGCFPFPFRFSELAVKPSPGCQNFPLIAGLNRHSVSPAGNVCREARACRAIQPVAGFLLRGHKFREGVIEQKPIDNFGRIRSRNPFAPFED